MDDILSPGGSGYRGQVREEGNNFRQNVTQEGNSYRPNVPHEVNNFRPNVPQEGNNFRPNVPQEVNNFRPNVPQGNTGVSIAEGYVSTSSVMGSSQAMVESCGAVDMRFNPPMGPETMYFRRDGNYRPQNYVQGVDNTYRPTGMLSANMGYPNPYVTGIPMGINFTSNSGYTCNPMSDIGKEKNEAASCRFSEVVKGDNTKNSEIEQDIIDLASNVTKSMAGNETEHVRFDKQSAEDATALDSNIEEAIPNASEKQIKRDNVYETEKEISTKGDSYSKTDTVDDKEMKVSPEKGSSESKTTNDESPATLSKEIKSEYFENTKAISDTHSGSDTEPVSDSFKADDAESPEKKLKLSVKIRRHTRSSNEPIFMIEEKPKIQKPEELKHACDLCEKRYGRKDHLRRHIQSAHTKERPFICKVCALTFPRKDRLVRHERKHSGCPQYPCLICGKKFFRKDSLGKHLMTGVGCRQRDESIFCKCKKSSEETVKIDIEADQSKADEAATEETVTEPVETADEKADIWGEPLF